MLGTAGYRRRALGLGLASLLIAGAVAPRGVAAQNRGKAPRIGVLRWGVPGDDGKSGLTAALTAAGYQDGKTIHIEWRWATRADLAHQYALELAGMELDLLVGSATPAAIALRDVHPAAPIVMAGAADPVGAGLIASLARPGGNVTGVSLNLPVMVPKQLELLRETLPDLQRAAFLGSTLDKATPLFIEQAKSAAQVLGVQLQLVLIAQAGEFETAAESMRHGSSQAVVVQPLFTLGNSSRLANVLAQRQLPSISALRPFALAGGLMSYGPNRVDTWNRAVSFIDRVLKGARPSDLPVEEPTNFELAINLKTAKLLDVAVPRSVLLRADEMFR